MTKPNNIKEYLESLQKWKQHGLAFIVILVIMTIYFAPMLFQNQGPPASDIQAWEGASKSIRDYNATHTDLALWATNIFSGMPASNVSVPIPVYSIDSILKAVDNISIPWQYVYFIFGGMFFYLFLRILGLPWLSSLFGALIFILLPHHLGLINAGHNTKIRAIMLSPFLAWGFMYYVKKTSLLSFALLTLGFALEARSNHYQIVYYAGFLLLFLGLPYLIRYIKSGKWKKLGTQVGLLLVALLLSGVIAGPKLILTEQYLPYSIRGSSGETEQTTAGGLEKDYATQWSFPPAEMLTFLIPNYFGGSSQYEYSGDAVQQLQGRTIPGYWGKMPFTTSTEYLGIFTVLFSLIGIIAFWKKSMIKSLVILSILALLISFGRYFSVIFDVFFQYFPLFNKFRVPSSILFLLEFTVPIFAAFGLHKLLEMNKEDYLKWMKISGSIIGILIVIGLIPVLFGSSFQLAKPQELTQYPQETLDLLKTARLDMLTTDAWRLVIYSVIGGGLFFAYLRKKISGNIFYPVLILLMLVDMYTIDHRFLSELQPQKEDQPPFTKTQIDQYMLEDEGLFRVFPVGNLFGNNRWCYFHQSIGGYHAAKMYLYQKMIEENLYHSLEAGNNINWNIMKLLNVKYLVSTQPISSDSVSAVGQEPDTQWILYEMNNPFPRAWMVYSTRVIGDESEQRTILNQQGFDPAVEAIVSQDILGKERDNNAVLSTGETEVIEYDANHIAINTSTPAKGLLVISENYIPIWWEAFLDGNKVPIHKVNTLQRGIVVPEGEHTVELVAEASIFQASLIGANVLVWIIHGIIIIVIGLKIFYPERLKSGLSDSN